MPMPWSRTHSSTDVSSTRDPMPIRVPSSEYLTALAASWSHAWVIRTGSSTARTIATFSNCQSRFPSAFDFTST